MKENNTDKIIEPEKNDSTSAATFIEETLNNIIGEVKAEENTKEVKVAETKVEKVTEDTTKENTIKAVENKENNIKENKEDLAQTAEAEQAEATEVQTEEKIVIPDLSLLESEFKREKFKKVYNRTLRATINTLVVVAAISVLIVTLWMPVLQIYGNSMAPNLEEGDMLISIKSNDFEKGDMVAFYYGNKLLVKRFIAGPSQWVNIDKEGNVYVDDVLVEEDYVKEKGFGDTNIVLPYQVPDGKYFVLGDNRKVSIDSRNTVLGCPSDEQIVGKIVFRVWPLSRIGNVE